MKETVIPIVTGAFGTILKGLLKGFGRVENRKTSRDYPHDNIVKIGENTEKSSGDLRRHVLTQTPAEGNQQPTLVWKTRHVITHIYTYI